MKDAAREEREKEKIAEGGIVRKGDDALTEKKIESDRDRDLRLQKSGRKIKVHNRNTESRKGRRDARGHKKGTAIAGGNDDSKSPTAKCGQVTTSPKGG